MSVTAQEIIKFWFEETKPAYWFKKDDQFDQLLIDRFSEVHQQATRAELFDWRSTAEGRLAEVIVLDQFSRNMFRNSPLAFAYDALALVLAQEAIALGEHQKLTSDQRSFLYMPYMHSESLKIHEVAVQLFSEPGHERSLDYELRHKVIIERFGRYPHRNEVLGRVSTAEEVAFLCEPGSSF